MANSVDPDQTAPIGAVCSGSTPWFHAVCHRGFLNISSVMLGNYLQQTTSTDDIFRCIFFFGALRIKYLQNSDCSNFLQRNKAGYFKFYFISFGSPQN